MTRLNHLLLAAESGALRDNSPDSLAALVAEVRKERARMYRRAVLLAMRKHDAIYSPLPASQSAAIGRHWRALRRLGNILRGKPAFGGGK